MTSELRTKKGVSSLPRTFSASFSGPAVPRGSDSTENSILTLYCSSYCRAQSEEAPDLGSGKSSHLLKSLGHRIWPVIDGEDNVGNARCGKSFDLVEYHGTVGKFDQWFGEGQGLRCIQRRPSGHEGLAIVAKHAAEIHTRGLSRVPNPPTRMRAIKISHRAPSTVRKDELAFHRGK